MPDYNPAVAAGINPNPVNLGSTINSLTQLQVGQAHAGLLQLQQMQQAREYNAL